MLNFSGQEGRNWRMQGAGWDSALWQPCESWDEQWWKGRTWRRRWWQRSQQVRRPPLIITSFAASFHSPLLTLLSWSPFHMEITTFRSPYRGGRSPPRRGRSRSRSGGRGRSRWTIALLHLFLSRGSWHWKFVLIQEPEKKPQESFIQEREQGQGQEQVQERPTQEEEQVKWHF